MLAIRLFLFLACASFGLGQEKPKGSPSIVVDTKGGTVEGIPFGQDGEKTIKALPFKDENLRNAALAAFAEFMKPPRKASSLAIPFPGASGVSLRFNRDTGEFAHLQITSTEARTTEGLGVGSSFEDFVARYGEAKLINPWNQPTLYSFGLPNPFLTAIALSGKNSPVTAIMIAYDLRRGKEGDKESK